MVITEEQKQRYFSPTITPVGLFSFPHEKGPRLCARSFLYAAAPAAVTSFSSSQ